jgi:hypothetical protein
MEEAISEFDYETAEVRARAALARFEELAPDRLVTVHATLGTLLYARGEAVEARRQFAAALSLDPTLELDPVLVSPPTIEFFETVRRETARAPAAVTTVPETRYVVLDDRRPGAAVRSLVAPGWGQFYKGDRAKGVALAVAAAVTSGGAIYAHNARRDARNEYLAATSPDEAERLYAPYNDWHRARTAFAIGAASVWAVALVDAVVTGAPRRPGTERLSLQPSAEGTGVTLRARF